MKLCSLTAVVLHLLLLGNSNAFTSNPQQTTGSSTSSFTQVSRLTSTHQNVGLGRNSVQLSMMFDQLTNALTSVAKEFGPKKRYVRTLRMDLEHTNHSLTLCSNP